MCSIDGHAMSIKYQLQCCYIQCAVVYTVYCLVLNMDILYWSPRLVITLRKEKNNTFKMYMLLVLHFWRGSIRSGGVCSHADMDTRTPLKHTTIDHGIRKQAPPKMIHCQWTRDVTHTQLFAQHNRLLPSIHNRSNLIVDWKNCVMLRLWNKSIRNQRQKKEKKVPKLVGSMNKVKVNSKIVTV